MPDFSGTGPFRLGHVIGPGPGPCAKGNGCSPSPGKTAPADAQEKPDTM